MFEVILNRSNGYFGLFMVTYHCLLVSALILHVLLRQDVLKNVIKGIVLIEDVHCTQGNVEVGLAIIGGLISWHFDVGLFPK